MTSWLWLAVGSAIFAGLTSILAKIGIKQTDSNVVTAIRTVVVLIFAWAMVFFAGSWHTIGSISVHTFIFLILSGIATGASWLCYFKALQMGDVNKVAPIDKSSTVLTMLLAFLFLGEKLTVLKGISVLLIFTGTMLMIARSKKAGEQPENGEKKTYVPDDKGGHSRWLLYAVLSAVFASLTSILAKVGIDGVESNLGTAIRTCVVLVMAWIVVFVTGKQNEIRSVTLRDGFFICLSGVATGASWLCYYKALQTGPASVVVPIDKLSIVITVIFSYLFLHEKLSWKALGGLLLIVAGTLLLLV